MHACMPNRQLRFKYTITGRILLFLSLETIYWLPNYNRKYWIASPTTFKNYFHDIKTFQNMFPISFSTLYSYLRSYTPNILKNSVLPQTYQPTKNCNVFIHMVFSSWSVFIPLFLTLSESFFKIQFDCDITIPSKNSLLWATSRHFIMIYVY